MPTEVKLPICMKVIQRSLSILLEFTCPFSYNYIASVLFLYTCHGCLSVTFQRVADDV